MFSLLGQIGSRLLALAFFARLARVIGPERYGDYGLGAAFGILFVVLVEPGLNQLLTRDGARDRSQLAPLAELGLGYKLAAIAVTWPLMLALAAALGYRGPTLWAVALAGGTTLLLGLEDHAAAVLVAQERLDLESGLRLTSKVLFAGLGLVALALGLSFVAVLATLASVQLAAGLLGLLLAASTGVPLRVRFYRRRIGARVREAWPLAATSVLWLLTMRLDQLIASQLGVPQSDLGDYNGAVKIVEALILFPAAVNTTFQPLLAKAWVSGRERCSSEVELALSTALSMTVPVVVGGAWLAQPLAVFVYGPAFVPVGTLLAIQLVGLLAVAVQFSCFPALIAAGALPAQTRIVASNLVLNVVLNLLLVPRLGVRGASLAAALGGLVASAGCLAALRGLELKVRLWRAAWRPVLAAAMMAGALLAMGERLPLLGTIAVGGATYLGAFVVLGGGTLLAALRERRRSAGQAAPSAS